MSLLTPDDVKNKLFTTVRLREGYNQVEVDNFLDEVYDTLEAVGSERDALSVEVARLRLGSMTP